MYFETKDDALVMTDAQTTTKGDGTVLLTSAVAFEEDLSKITFGTASTMWESTPILKSIVKKIPMPPLTKA